MSQNELTDIPIGIFSFQIKLGKLDLSQNLLKILSFDLFLPSIPYLNILLLAQKRISLAPIKLNCDYLRKFMRSINWNDLEVDNPDPNLLSLDNEMNVIDPRFPMKNLTMMIWENWLRPVCPLLRVSCFYSFLDFQPRLHGKFETNIFNQSVNQYDLSIYTNKLIIIYWTWAMRCVCF